jgi:hypothetical protein
MGNKSNKKTVEGILYHSDKSEGNLKIKQVGKMSI